MTFISHEESREAQKVRNSRKDKRGRAVGKYETPDRPGTNLAYSLTGKAPAPLKGEMAAALEAAGLAPKPRKRKPRKVTRPAPKPEHRRGQGTQKGRPKARPTTAPKPGPQASPAALAAMRRVAGK